MNMTPLLYILFSLMSFACIMFGWGGEGYLHYASLILGGMFFGHVLTEALNYVGGTEHE
jgi:hypothetical protein